MTKGKLSPFMDEQWLERQWLEGKRLLVPDTSRWKAMWKLLGWKY